MGSEMNTEEKDLLDCKERAEAYFHNMAKYEKDIVVHVRFLNKIFHAAMDDYSIEDRLWLLNKLIDTANEEEDQDYKALDFCYAYKINKIDDLGCDDRIEIFKLENVLEAGICSDDTVVPETIMDYLKKRPGQPTIKFIESLHSDEELLELFNVKIPRDHFFYRGR